MSESKKIIKAFCINYLIGKNSKKRLILHTGFTANFYLSSNN